MRSSQTILGIPFAHPLVCASGYWAKTTEEMRKVADGGAAGVVSKSYWFREHQGHPEPVYHTTDHWTINAVGLPDPGGDYAMKELAAFLNDHPVPLIVSIVSDSVEGFAEAAQHAAALKPDAIEANLACPNCMDTLGRPFAYAADTTTEVTRAIKNQIGSTPLFIKLSANVHDIGVIAQSAVDTGADGLSMINTVGPGLAIDIDSRSPILGNGVGGVSGPGIKPITVRCIYDCYKATNGAVPIIGMGGVTSGRDAIELMMAGASLVAIGTAVLQHGYDIFNKVHAEMNAWCEKKGVDDVAELIGMVHRA